MRSEETATELRLRKSKKIQTRKKRFAAETLVVVVLIPPSRAKDIWEIHDTEHRLTSLVIEKRKK